MVSVESSRWSTSVATGDLIRVIASASYGLYSPAAIVVARGKLSVANEGDSVTEVSKAIEALVNVISGHSYAFQTPNTIAGDSRGNLRFPGGSRM